MKEDDFCYRVTLFFTSILIFYLVESVQANHFTTTPIYNMENQIIDSLKKQNSLSDSPQQITSMKNEEVDFRLGKSVTDRGNKLRNEYLHSTRETTSIGYGLFVRSDYFKNNSSKYSTSKLDHLKSSYPAQNNSRNNSLNTYYSTHKTSIDPNNNFQKNKESQIEKYQAINTENKNHNYENYAERIKYLIMGDEKATKANPSQNAIAISSLMSSSSTRKEQYVNSLQSPLNPPIKLPDTMILDQHTRIMLQMNHESNRDKLLNSFGKKGEIEKFMNSTKNSVNDSIDNTRAGQKNLILDIRNDLGKNGSYGQNMNHEEHSRLLYQDHVGRPQSHEIHSHYSKFEPYSNSHMNSNALYECKTCRVNSQQIYSPMTNHMRDVANNDKNSGQGNIVPMNNIIRNSPQGFNPGGFKVNSTTNQRVVVNNFMNPNKYDTLGSNSMTVNTFEKGVGINPNVMNPHKIKAGVDMQSHPMQPNKHHMDSFVMQDINHNKQELAPVSHVSMKQNMYTVNENGYSYIPPNSYHVNAHHQHDVNNVNEEHMMMPYNYKIPNNMMHKPHVGLHSQNDEKEYMGQMDHHNHGMQNSMMMIKPHKHLETEDNHEKDNMMKEHYYHYDKPSTELAKPHVEAHIQNIMEKGNFMEQMMMLMMMKFSDHMAPNNVINFHVGPDKQENMKMEPMMKFNRLHPMHPMLRPLTSAMPDKKEEDKYAVVKHPGHDKKEDEKYVIVKMPSKPEEIIDHSYISHSPISWMSDWYPGLIFPDKKKIFTVIFLIIVVILAKKLLLALAVIKFFLALVPVLAFILLLKKYLLFLLITKGLKFFKKFKKVPHLLAVSPLFFFPIIVPFFYLCKGGESSTEYTITYPTFTYPTFTFPTFTFPTFIYPTFPTNPETTGRTEPPTHTLTTTTTTLTTLTTTTTMDTTMTETMTMNTESMATETMSMATHPMSMATQPMSMSSSSMSSPSMSMASPPMSMATQPMTMSGRIGVVQPTIRPVAKTTLPMKIAENGIKVKHTKLPALTQYKNDINSYKFKPPLKKTTPMSNASTDKKLSTSTYQNKKHPLRWHGVTKKPKPTKAMDKLVTNKQKISTFKGNCVGNKIPCKSIKKNTLKVKDQKNQQNNSSYYSKIGSLQNKNKPVSMKNIITNRDKQKLKAALQNGAIAKTSSLNKRKNKSYKSGQIVDENNLEDLSNGIGILRERFPRQSSTFLSLFNRMWSALASDRCMERIGCHLAVNSKSVKKYNSLILRVLQSLFSRRANRRIRSYIKAYQLGSKKEGTHFMCRYLFPCLGILKI